MCHNTAFDFNDNLIPVASIFFVRIVESRLGLSLYSEDELPIPLPADDDKCEEGGGKVGPSSLPEAGAPVAPPGPISIKPKRKRE